MNTTEPPIPWEETFWDWQAIDANGAVCLFKEKPTQGLRIWVPVSQAWLWKHTAEKPADFTKCIWQRPKKNSKEV